LDVGGIITVDDEEAKHAWTTDNDRMSGVLRDARVLRDYQCELVQAAVCAPLGRGVLKAPPGAGKTRVCAAICVFAANNGYICWHYVVKNSELVQQALRDMRTAIDEMLLILDANQLPYIRPEISGSTYANIKVHGDEFDGLLIDECHHLPTRTRAIPYAACRARYRIGLSATPTDRSDEDGNALVKGLLGPVLISIPRERIVKAGHLAGSIVKQVPIGA
jgi:superfamily II DNA or RNA helicase